MEVDEFISEVKFFLEKGGPGSGIKGHRTYKPEAQKKNEKKDPYDEDIDLPPGKKDKHTGDMFGGRGNGKITDSPMFDRTMEARERRKASGEAKEYDPLKHVTNAAKAKAELEYLEGSIAKDQAHYDKNGGEHLPPVIDMNKDRLKKLNEKIKAKGWKI